MEPELMAALEVKLRTQRAWWVRPALAAAFLLGSVCEPCADRCIDFIVDKGIKVELADS